MCCKLFRTNHKYLSLSFASRHDLLHFWNKMTYVHEKKNYICYISLLTALHNWNIILTMKSFHIDYGVQCKYMYKALHVITFWSSKFHHNLFRVLSLWMMKVYLLHLTMILNQMIHILALYFFETVLGKHAWFYAIHFIIHTDKRRW